MYVGLIGLFVVVVLAVSVIGLVIEVLFLLNLMRLLEAVHPQNRAMSPGLVWLNLIPVFNFGWMIYTVIKISESVRRENASRRVASVDEGDTYTVGLVFAILSATGFVIYFRPIRKLGLLGIHRPDLPRSIRHLDHVLGEDQPFENRAGADGRSGLRAGWSLRGRRSIWSGGPYSPGPGYGAGYGPGPTGQAYVPPPETERTCSQCGRKLNPNDRFCAACGTPAPKE